jgi:hypothetical protein
MVSRISASSTLEVMVALTPASSLVSCSSFSSTAFETAGHPSPHPAFQSYGFSLMLTSCQLAIWACSQDYFFIARQVIHLGA